MTAAIHPQREEMVAQTKGRSRKLQCQWIGSYYIA